MKMIFGEYIKTMDSSVLTSYVNDPTRAKGYLLNLKYARLIYYSQLSIHQKLNNVLIKYLVGDDETITARELYKNN
jgi:hypothetical protein